MGKCDEEVARLLKVSEMLHLGFKFIGSSPEDMPKETPPAVLDQITIEEGRNFAMESELKEIAESIRRKLQ